MTVGHLEQGQDQRRCPKQRSDSPAAVPEAALLPPALPASPTPGPAPLPTPSRVTGADSQAGGD